jgi:DNA-binding MarR family transcriptional regulator
MSSTPSAGVARLYARPGFLLRRAHQISVAIFEGECADVGLTPAQYGTLTVLKSLPGIDQTRLARAQGFDKVTMLRVLRGLEARGLVVRQPSPENRRNLSIVLSDDGARLLETARRPVERAYKRLMEPLSAAQQAQLLKLLNLLCEGLEHEARAPFVPE